MPPNVLKRIFGGSPRYSYLIPLDTQFRLNDSGLIGQSSIVEACMGWITNTLPEAPLSRIRNIQDDTLVMEHSLLDLIATTNPVDPLSNLLSSTAECLSLEGNAFWFVERDSFSREPIALWWIPLQDVLVEGTVYQPEYRVNGRPVRRDNIIHFKKGLDKRDQRRGQSKLKAAMLEISTDKEVMKWINSYLFNGAVPGLIVTGKTADGSIAMGQEEVEKLKARLNAEFQGDNRGSTLVSAEELTITQVGWKPDTLDFTAIHDISETRVCAILGVPPIVISLSSGLKNSTYSNYLIAKRSAYESTIIPLQKLIAATLKKKLFPDYNLSPASFELEFDNSRAQALREDPNNLAARINRSWINNLITHNQALSALGWKTIDDGDYYYAEKWGTRVGVGSLPTDRATKGEKVPATGG